jgi:hypothetical protein
MVKRNLTPFEDCIIQKVRHLGYSNIEIGHITVANESFNLMFEGHNAHVDLQKKVIIVPITVFATREEAYKQVEHFLLSYKKEVGF